MARAEDDTVTFAPVEDERDRYLASPAIPVQVIFGARSDIGKVRRQNEDHYLVARRTREHDVVLTNLPAELEPTREHAYALLVADGMGGAAFGELASRLALQTAWEWGSLVTSWVMRMNPREAEEMQRRARAFINVIHRAIKHRAKSEPALAGMGTTLTVAYTMGLDAVIIHVGDSRAYLLRGGGIYRLTDDHTLAQQLTDLGVPKEETVAFRHVLTNSLGAKADEVITDSEVVQLADGDRLLLCSDGLSDCVTDLEIAQTAARWPHPQDACHALVDQALDRGGKDNITVVMAQYAVVR